MFFFFFNDPAPPEIYPLSLHDALPISRSPRTPRTGRDRSRSAVRPRLAHRAGSHALEPQLGARRVHHRRRDLRDATLAGVIGVDLLYHPAHEPRDAAEPLLRRRGPGGSAFPRPLMDTARAELEIGRAHA